MQIIEDFLKELNELSKKHGIILLAMAYRVPQPIGKYKYLIEDGECKIEWKDDLN